MVDTSQVPLSVYWGTDIQEPEIEKGFSRFLMEYQTTDGPHYMMQFNQMTETESFVLKIEGGHLHQYSVPLYNWMIRYPGEVIPIFDRVA